MIIGKNDIREYFKKINKKYFAIYYKGGESTGSPIIKSENEETDVEKTYGEFEDALSLLRAGEYTLVSNNTSKVAERGGNRINFRITLEESMSAAVKETTTPAAVGALGNTYSVEDMLAKAKIMGSEEFERLMAKHKAEQLQVAHDEFKKRAEDAEKKLEDPFNRFIGALAPHADKFVAGFIGTKPAPAAIVPMGAGMMFPAKVSGVEHDEQLHDNEDTSTALIQQAFEDFTTALQNARPDDWLNILAKLTKVIKEDPEKFNTALKFI
jgi:hypothetical protein